MPVTAQPGVDGGVERGEAPAFGIAGERGAAAGRGRLIGNDPADRVRAIERALRAAQDLDARADFRLQIGRASRWERVCQSVSISVVAGSLQKKSIILLA